VESTLKNRYLNFALPFALIPVLSIFGDEVVTESHACEQQEDHHYHRVSAGFDMFWSLSSFKKTGQDCNMKSYHESGKSKDSFEGLRFTFDSLKPNSLYTGINFLVAHGDHRSKIYLNRKKVEDNSIRSNSWTNLDMAVGYNFQPAFSPHTLLSVFVGPGFHWERAFYHNARWNYAMTGFKLSQDLTESLSFGVDFKTMYSFGTQDPRGVTSWERKWEKHFWGIEMGTPVTWHIGEKRKFDLQFKPYMLKWNMNSMVTALGLTAALGYSF
jgi:hypothetical protein